MPGQVFIQDLKLNIDGDVLDDDVSLGLYSSDASVYQIKPVVVVLPKHNEDVFRAIQISRDHGVSVLPRGGGTSLAGQTVGESMILDFSKYMNQILEFNESERWVIVQPGLVRDELNRFLADYGLQFAPDPATSSRANIGGMIGNNSSGTKSILYGKTIDHVLETKVILADSTVLNFNSQSPAEFLAKQSESSREGEIYRAFNKIINDNRAAIEASFPKVMRRVQGYNLDEFIIDPDWNLSKIICGSEGTLATLLEAKLNLETLPTCKAVCVVHFDNLPDAIRSVEPMLNFQPAAIEILDNNILELSRSNLTTARHCHFIHGNPKAIQIVEFYGKDSVEVLDRARHMVVHLKEQKLGYAYPIFPEGSAYDDVWIIRKKGLGLMLGMKGSKKPLAFIEDAAIPSQHLPDYIEQVLDICKQNDTETAMYAHASVGVIHVRPILDLRSSTDIGRFKKISEETFQLVKTYGGSWSGEHGDGLVRSQYLKRYFGEHVYDLLVQVKEIFDPAYRMNPGKIIDAPPIDQHLRYGPTYQDQDLDTSFKYRNDGSFGHAVHMCTGVGECRKLNGGTMCPSFRATLDEEDSTRGRANALRLAMSGQLKEGLNHPRIKRTLDLCLSCKACKSECPSNVDMAKLKSEVYSLHYEQHGSSLRDRIVRDSPAHAARWSGKAAPAINTLIRSAPVRWLMEKTLGFHKNRKPPNYATHTFSSWFRKNYVKPLHSTGRVALFTDTYLNYHQPSIGQSAVKLLSQLGLEVHLADVGCCQRPGISHGFLKHSISPATTVLKQLKRFADDSIPIVVCEPSCVSALTDDIPDLIEDQNLRDVCKHIYPIDQWVAELLTTDASTSLRTKASKIFIHGHCHHKALFGMRFIRSIFESIPETKTDIIPSGCCGMAGSFGYEKEHYQVSKKIAQQVLIPAIDNIPLDALIIADGFSCRHQIKDFTGRNAVHWVEALNV